ncbi:MAG: hypothetical protein ACJ0FF_01925 [Gammaproteobacteria bacterium]|tara:strand:+ start:52 stop:303 length:252 start_codon:yes stop_codon:yes gene_type:complete
MKLITEKNWSNLSHALGVGIGFLNFYILYFSWDFSWGISFAVAFALGFLASKAFDNYLSKKFEKNEAKRITDAAKEFESNDLF